MKQRMINTKFWSDSFVVDKLNPLDRYLFLYLLTNEKTNIAGIYELAQTVVCRETGIDKETIPIMFKTLEPKAYYFDGWVILPNFLKNQNYRSPKIISGISAELRNVPEKVLNKAFSIGYGYGIDTISHSNPNSNPNSNPKDNICVSDETRPPSPIFKKTLSNYRDLRRVESGRPPMEKHPPSLKQLKAIQRLACLDYFHAQGIKNGFDYLEEEDEQANRKFIGLARAFEKRYAKNWKDVVDWWFAGDNEWCDYHPSNFFSINTYLKFENNNKKSNIVEL